MKPLVTFADAEAVMLSYLGPSWASRAEAYKPDTMSNSFPGTLAAGQTHLQVELDGTPTVEYPSTERATVRFTFWTSAGAPSDAKAGAHITQAFVATHPGDGDVFSTRILTGPLKGQDAATKNRFVSFTARITLRPTAL